MTRKPLPPAWRKWHLLDAATVEEEDPRTLCGRPATDPGIAAYVVDPTARETPPAGASTCSSCAEAQVRHG